MAMPTTGLAQFHGVIPAKAGISVSLSNDAMASNRDSRFRGNDAVFGSKRWGSQHK